MKSLDEVRSALGPHYGVGRLHTVLLNVFVSSVYDARPYNEAWRTLAPFQFGVPMRETVVE